MSRRNLIIGLVIWLGVMGILLLTQTQPVVTPPQITHTRSITQIYTPRFLATVTPTPGDVGRVVPTPDTSGEVAPTVEGTPAGDVSFMIFGDPAEKAAYDTLVAAFQAEHPDIRINLIHIPGQNDYRTRLANDFAAGTPADVVLINYRRMAPFAARDVLEPLSPYLRRSTIISERDFYPQAVTPFYWQGRLMCIPQNISSLVVYYNKSLFDQAGIPYPADDWTWDDFLNTAKTLTRDLDGDGEIDQYGLGLEPTTIRLLPFIWQNRGDLLDWYEYPSGLTLMNAEAMEAIEWFMALQREHHVVPDAAQEEALDNESRFMNGTTAMYFNSRRGVPTYREIEGFDWDVAPLPRGKDQVGVLHADAYCMARAAANKEAAWTFIEYANSPEGQIIVAQSGRTVPSLIAVAESSAFLDPNARPANSRVFLDTIPFIRPLPVLQTWVDIEETLDREWERAFYGLSTVREAVRSGMLRTLEYVDFEQTFWWATVYPDPIVVATLTAQARP